jgi:hypothetical protein
MTNDYQNGRTGRSTVRSLSIWTAVILYAVFFMLQWGFVLTEAAYWFLPIWFAVVAVLRIGAGRGWAALGSIGGASALLGSSAVFPSLSPVPYADSVVPIIDMMIIGGVYGLVSFIIVECAVGTVKLVGLACGMRNASRPAVTAEPKPVKFQFTIRTLLVGAVLVSLPLSWLSFMRARIQQQQELLVPIKQLNPIPKWGAGYVTVLHFPDFSYFSPDDDALPHIARFTKLRSLSLRGRPGVTDAGLVHISKLKDLGYLSIKGTRISPEGVEELKRALPDCNINY